MNPDALIGLAQASGFLVLASTGIGVFVGLLVGMIPGMTISTGIIVVLPATFVLPADISIALLLGLYVGGMTGGSFSAVLLNIPGTPSASATALDGFPMAARGEAGRALGIARGLCEVQSRLAILFFEIAFRAQRVDQVESGFGVAHPRPPRCGIKTISVNDRRVAADTICEKLWTPGQTANRIPRRFEGLE